MIGITVCTEAPDNIIVLKRHIHWSVTFFAGTETSAAACCATAVIIGNQVVPLIDGVFTGTHPSYWGQLYG